MDTNETVLQSPMGATAVSGRWKVWVPVTVVAVAAVVLGFRWATGGAKPVQAVRAVPVSTAAARAGDMPVNLMGLGTVIPTDAVTLRTRVDGQVMKINFKEGQFVREGDLLIQIDPRPYQVQLLQAEGQMAKDQAALKNATLDLERIKSLYAQKIISQQQLDTQLSLVDQDQAAVKSDLAGVESAKLNLTYSRITAPVSGKVGLRMVDPGNMVHASDTNGLVTLTPVSPINVMFTIPADSIQVVMESTRQGKSPMVEVYDRDLSHKLATGTLLAVDNQVDATTGTVRIKAQFANKDNALFPNQFVNARLLVNTLKNALMVPAAAVQQSPQGTFVYVVQPDSTVAFRKVEVQLTDGETTALRQGVANGERVVINGLDKLRPGSKVSDDAQAAPKAAK
jgi:membrane fusion protein, multidrug efflux system